MISRAWIVFAQLGSVKTVTYAIYGSKVPNAAAGLFEFAAEVRDVGVDRTVESGEIWTEGVLDNLISVHRFPI